MMNDMFMLMIISLQASAAMPHESASIKQSDTTDICIHMIAHIVCSHRNKSTLLYIAAAIMHILTGSDCLQLLLCVCAFE